MDWARAIERNSIALRGIIESLFAMLGLVGEVTVELLPENIRRAVLRVLGPAESAVRRLVVIAARGLVVKPAPSRPMPKLPMGGGSGSRAGFKLFDPVITFASCYREPGRAVMPRIHFFSYDPRVAAIWASRTPATPAPDDTAKTQRLIRRLHAIKSALDDLPRQARRLARWRMKRENDPALKFKSPLRPGPPPGRRKNQTHDVDEILAECHWLARDALRVDTS
jgi:hypothetical protein